MAVRQCHKDHTVAKPEDKHCGGRDCVLSAVKMAASGAGTPGRLVQYVVVRSDLVHKLSWPLGAVITQACHAATAAIHLHYADPDTQRYLEELDSMHKVVLGVSFTIMHMCGCHCDSGFMGAFNNSLLGMALRVLLVSQFFVFVFMTCRG